MGTHELLVQNGAKLKMKFSGCRYPREIPELPWYRSAFPQMIMAGGRLIWIDAYLVLYTIIIRTWPLLREDG